MRRASTRRCCRDCSNRRRFARACHRTAAADTGLAEGTPIVAGAGDQAAGAVGMGITRPGAVSATIGTSGVVFAATDRPARDPGGRLHTFCHAIPDRWHVMGVTQAAGLSLRWLREQLGLTDHGDEGYALMTREAAAIAPGADGVLWAPYLMGERTPHLDPGIRAALVGLAANHTRGHIVRARARRRRVQPARLVHDLQRAARARSARAPRRRRRSLAAVARDPGERVRARGRDGGRRRRRRIRRRAAGRRRRRSVAERGRSLRPTGSQHGRRRRRTRDTVAVMNERYAAYRRIYPALRLIELRAKSLQDDQCLINSLPQPEHKFSFGLWTVGNRGRDPFGDVVRPALPPIDAVALLAEVGAWGVNLHDNDLVPIDATPSERDRIVKDFRSACERHDIVVPMATVNLFYDPVFRDGAFTANDARVRAYAVQKTMRAMDLGAELGAKIFVLWGGREGTETDACRRAGRSDQAAARGGELSVRVLDRSQVRLPVRARGQAERAARRHLHGDDRRVSRIHSHARSSGDGRREPGGGARADGGTQFRARRRAGVGGGQAVSHRPERPGAGPIRPGLPLRIGQSESGVLAGEVSRRRRLRRSRGISTRTRTGQRTTTASASSPAAACARI